MPKDNKKPLKKIFSKLEPCFGDPKPECVGTCPLEPECANKWLEEHKPKKAR